jgi:hypothetical protein
MNYAIEDIVMSDRAFCIFTEYTGKTFMDSLLISKKSPFYRSFIGDIFKTNGFKYFEKYIFDICYNIYVMNNVGIIHGDLHLNNVTIRPKYYKTYRNIDVVDDPFEMYFMGPDEKYIFILPSLAYNSAIIDFSRSFIDIAQIDSFADPSIPEHIFPVTGKKNKFISNQFNNMIHTYIGLFPELESNVADILDALKNNFSTVFKLFTTIDIYRFTKNLIQLFNINNPNISKASPQMMSLLVKINKLAHFYLTTEFHRLLSDKSHSKTIEQMEMPMLTIIVKTFSHLLIDEEKKYGNPIDVFNANNPLKYTLSDITKTPDHIRNIRYYDRDELPTYVKSVVPHLSETEKIIIVKREKILTHNKKVKQKNMENILQAIKDDAISLSHQLDL